MNNFNNTVAVITGGANGIGKSLAIALLESGASVAIADVNLSQATELASSLGEKARAYQCDVTERSQVEELAKNVLKDFGKINHVFANAGVAIAGSILSTAPAEFDWLLDVNVRGVFSTIQVFVPILIKSAEANEAAHFIITGSENSLGVPKTGPCSAYTLTKHASLALADTLRRDLSETGVKVSIFCPGVVDTKLYDARRTRQARYGGESAMPQEYAARASAAMAQGQSPDVTAALCLAGILNGEFLIITDPKIRDFSSKRSAEVINALDTVDTRLANWVSKQ
ncbi:SDR family NAD(P)-dependent oxidoreductase [Pseudomonas sp. BN414]|uniref:SDR family oxidoreductase n=1 Tax=Pseudomonas sp. BN414 TaxID=2567888 RepID=UPI00245907E3|nr:SDR family NAD(P)-dependent oxidoreductase [Pseudomonas sp. BN414]MDH4565170.1 SDR family NAD(P)-dependent oxidoreductase [Pseudomonas sp. BN414]